MHARVHEVTGRLKESEMFFARTTDFAIGPPSDAPLDLALHEPGWIPYCVDHESSSVVFTRIPAEIDLADAAFTYVTQYWNADRLLFVPFEALDALTAPLELPEIIWVFSTGRCGSTLLSHALNGSERVWSLSEPSPFDRSSLDLASDASLIVEELIVHVAKLLHAGRPNKALDVLALKLRSQSIYRADAFHRATPNARYIFMYRDAIAWTASFHQFLQGIGTPEVFDHDTRDSVWRMLSGAGPIDFLGRYIDLNDETVHMDRVFPAGWVLHLKTYLKHLAAGIPFLALRYNELSSAPETTTRRLFAHCGLAEYGVARALEAFEKDSQEGTSIARREGRRRLGVESADNIRATLAKDPQFADPNLILPDIYTRQPAAA